MRSENEREREGSGRERFSVKYNKEITLLHVYKFFFKENKAVKINDEMKTTKSLLFDIYL